MNTTIPPINYKEQISKYFRLADLTTEAYFPHALQPQGNASAMWYRDKLIDLANNILDPLWERYPGFRINSGFRPWTTGKSQHEQGEACDIQWPGISRQEYLNRINWIADNMMYDQLILEYGINPWIHVSYDTVANRPIGTHNKNLTWYKKRYYVGFLLFDK